MKTCRSYHQNQPWVSLPYYETYGLAWSLSSLIAGASGSYLRSMSTLYYSFDRVPRLQSLLGPSLFLRQLAAWSYTMEEVKASFMSTLVRTSHLLLLKESR